MMHPDTRAYLRDLIQAHITDMAVHLNDIDADDVLAFTTTTAELVKSVQHLADLMTHHVDDAKPAEQPREVRAALHLFENVLRNATVIRDAEVKLGSGDGANTEPHILLRDMRKFLDSEKRAADFEAARQLDEPLRVASVVKEIASNGAGNGKTARH